MFIPEPGTDTVSGETEERHKFRLKPATTHLKIIVKDVGDEPLRDLPYLLTIDGKEYPGTTDGDGLLDEEIPVKAQGGTLEIDGNTFPVQVGHLDPISETTGVQARLHNLGFDCGQIDGRVGPKLTEAIKNFQSSVELDPTGELDDITRQKLVEKHGC